jgi:hypothetical protein
MKMLDERESKYNAREVKDLQERKKLFENVVRNMDGNRKMVESNTVLIKDELEECRQKL